MKNEKSLRRKIQYIILIPIILAILLTCVTIYVNGLESKVGTFSLAILVVYIIISIIIYLRMIPSVDSVVLDYSLEQGKIQKELLADLEIPYAIMDTSGHIMWANKMFKETIGVNPESRIKRSIDVYFPELVPDIIDTEDGIDLSLVFDERKEEYSDDDIVLAIYLFDETEMKRLEKTANDQKLYAGLLYLDNYDEVMDNLEDVKHSILTALVERKINMYLSNIDAIVKHTENDKYFFVFKQQYMQTLRDDKFSILDDVKNINVGNEIAMTLSIGIGADADIEANGFMNAYDNARNAIGLAMGRGGDQAAVKQGDQVTYYGGHSAGTEKTTRVKARVKAQAFEELLQTKEKVIIMAHKRPDADALGSSIGIYRLVSTMGKKAYIVINEITEAIRPVMNTFKLANVYAIDADFYLNSSRCINVFRDQMTGQTLSYSDVLERIIIAGYDKVSPVVKRQFYSAMKKTFKMNMKNKCCQNIVKSHELSGFARWKSL